MSHSPPAPRLHLVTYATWRFRYSARHLIRTARAHGVERAHLYTPSRLVREILRLKAHRRRLRERRGSGHWMWKPFAIGAVLGRVPDGDLVLYVDAGTEVVSSLRPLQEIAETEAIVLFHQTKSSTLGEWTKRDCFVLLGLDREEAHRAPMLCGGYQLYRAGPEARSFVDELALACTDRRILTDDPNECGLDNLPGFIDHRHDQSVLSLLALKRGITTFPDPSQFGDTSGAAYPQLLHSHRERVRLLRPLETVRHLLDRL